MNTLPAQNSAVSDSLAKSLNGAFSSVYEKVAPSVVVIEVGKASGQALTGFPKDCSFSGAARHRRLWSWIKDPGSSLRLKAMY